MKTTGKTLIIITFLLLFLFSGFAFAQFIEPPPTTDARQDEENFFNSIVGIINIIFAVAIIASLIGFIFAGIRFIIAGGSETTIENAHNTWIAALIGLISALIGYILINVVKYFFQ